MMKTTQTVLKYLCYELLRVLISLQIHLQTFLVMEIVYSENLPSRTFRVIFSASFYQSVYRGGMLYCWIIHNDSAPIPIWMFHCTPLQYKDTSKDTIDCPEKAMKISHFNQTKQPLLSILRQNSATFLSTNERQRYICFEGNVSIFLIGQEAIQPMRDCNTLKSFPNPRQGLFIVTLIQTKPNLMTYCP